ncbi:MAG: hypothetical protein H6718_01175 [Polyangiaceae bacterium]|nr:hypothetical protein [Myxococcales bacterium]MCB9583973.1 hypothetical protein [Polyangiaceae bacterium]MCB9607771.1 hypothetical protein [Polyangiaceae bacterium]
MSAIQPDPGSGEASGEVPSETAPKELPPLRSVQAGSSLWWWFLVLVAIIGVWVIAMMFMRGPIEANDDDGIILLNPSTSASATP